MKPVLILQHMTADGPAYLATWLSAHGIAFEVRNSEAGDALPERIDAYGALAILGGEMSANDPLPSLRRAEDLFRQALAAGVPTLGHCLGGQLMARALGAAITASPQPEIGWQPIDVADTPAARDWFGDARRPLVFQWHAEAFGLPAGAQLLASSRACPHQAFAIGPHLGMQFHIELDAEKLGRWSASTDPTFLRWQAEHATVMDGATIRGRAGATLPGTLRLADRLYARWRRAFS